MLASFIVYLLYIVFTPQSVIDWAWRLPFLLGLPLSIFILYIRKSIPTNTRVSNMLTPIFRKQYFGKLVKTLVIVSFLEANVYVLFVWMPSYLQHFLGVSHINAMATNVCGLICLTMATLFFSYIGQYTNYKRSYLISVLLITFGVYPLLLLLQHTTTLITLVVIQLIFAILLGCVNGNTLFIVCNTFPPEVRNRAMGISITFPPAIVGGTAPLLCSYFIHVWHLNNFPGIYITIIGIMAFLVNIFL